MPAYTRGLSEEIHDPAVMKQGVEQVAPLVAPDGGKYVFVSDQAAAIEGDLQPTILTALEFAGMARVRAFRDAPKDTAVKALRHRSARSTVLFVDAPAPASGRAGSARPSRGASDSAPRAPGAPFEKPTIRREMY